MKIIPRIFVLVLFTFLTIQNSHSQTRNQGVSYERNDDKSVTFSYFKEAPGSVFAILKFNSLTNASCDVIKKTIKGYGSTLVTLHPNNTKASISFSYTSLSFFGNIDAKPDFQFKYILPFKNSTVVKVKNLILLDKKLGGSEPKNWKSYQFLAKPNDTVCAARKGVVIKTNTDVNVDNTTEYSYRNKSNSILIEHSDGTLANYSVLKKNSIMVEIGDVVFPSTPIAVAGTYDIEDNSQLRFTLFYLDESIKTFDLDKRKKESFANRKHYYNYMNPLFYVNSNEILKLKSSETYTAMCNESIAELEMSKREKKRKVKAKNRSKKN